MGSHYESKREALRSQIIHLSELKKQYEQLGAIEVESLGKEVKISIEQFNNVKIQIDTTRVVNLSDEEISGIIINMHNYGRSKISENINNFAN